jgi:hypothetical protein
LIHLNRSSIQGIAKEFISYVFPKELVLVIQPNQKAIQ